MDEKMKILLIDNRPDRKTRIAALKEQGFAVFPARKIQEAQSRCRPGAYDLIIVEGDQDRAVAESLIAEVRRCNPEQRLLLMADSPSSDAKVETVGTDADELVKQVKGSFRGPAKTSGTIAA